MINFIKTYDQFILTEEVYTYKRKYTELYPEKKLYMGSKLRNIVLNAIADGEVTGEEMQEIIKESGVSKSWIYKNKSFFNIVKDNIDNTIKFKLTPRALQLWQTVSSNINDNSIDGNTNKKPNFKSNYPDLLYMKKSPIGGYGVFAKTDIPKNTIFVFEYDEIDVNTAFKYTLMRLFPVDKSNTHGALLHNEGPFFNHSEDPHLYIGAISNKNKRFVFVLVKDIKQHEEIFINYGSKYFKIYNEIKNK